MKQIQETLSHNPYAGHAEQHIEWVHDWQSETGDTEETQAATPALAQAYATLALAYEVRRQTDHQQRAATPAPAAIPDMANTRQLIVDLTDEGDCHFDHHGGCQEHGYLSLQPGEKCPHTEAKEWVATYDAAPAEPLTALDIVNGTTPIKRGTR